MRFSLAAAVVLAVLAGCQTLPAPVQTSSQTASEDAPAWKTVSAPLSNLVVPHSARRGQSVLLKATATLGSSSCNKDAKLSAKVDQAARTVTLSATKQTRTGANVPCTRDLRSAEVEASFTPESAGTYTVVLEGEKSAEPAVLEVAD